MLEIPNKINVFIFNCALIDGILHIFNNTLLIPSYVFYIFNLLFISYITLSINNFIIKKKVKDKFIERFKEDYNITIRKNEVIVEIISAYVRIACCNEDFKKISSSEIVKDGNLNSNLTEL